MRRIIYIALLMGFTAGLNGQIDGIIDYQSIPTGVEKSLSIEKSSNGKHDQTIFNGNIQIWACENFYPNGGCGVDKYPHREDIAIIVVRQGGDQVYVLYDAVSNTFYPKYDEKKYTLEVESLISLNSVGFKPLQNFVLKEKATGLYGLVDREGNILEDFKHEKILDEVYGQRVIYGTNYHKWLWRANGKGKKAITGNIIEVIGDWNIYDGTYNEDFDEFTKFIDYKEDVFYTNESIGYLDVKILGDHFLVIGLGTHYLHNMEDEIIEIIDEEDDYYYSPNEESFKILRSTGKVEKYSFSNRKLKRIRE